MSGKRFSQNVEDKPKKTTSKAKKVGKVFLIIFIILLIMMAGVLAAGYGYIQSKLGKLNTVDIGENEIEITEGVEESLKGYRNIVLLGIDSRADNYDKGNRSDCIIIASINEKTKEVKLASVYRDTYLELTGRNLDKVTHAYAYGGPALTMSTLNTNLDLDIKEFVTVNFDAVEVAVNALGGIDLDITAEETKYINSYINELNRVTGTSSANITKAGRQHVDGTQALAYARIRYTAGGDYKRTERMRTVLMEMANAAKKKSITELNRFADKILPKIYTNISAGEILALIPDVLSYKITDNIGWPYDTKGATINGVWYGPPVTLESNVKQLHKELFGEINYEPSTKVKEISNKIIKKTGYSN